MESQITSTSNSGQAEVLSTEMDQSTDSPTFVIRDVFSLNADGQSTVPDDVLNSFTMGPDEQLPLHAQPNISQDCDSCSETDDEFFDCITCGEGFSEMNNLLTHTLTHTKQSKTCVALTESSKENIEVINNASPYPDNYVGENVDLQVVDLTDDANTGVHKRIVFGDIANNDIGQSQTHLQTTLTQSDGQLLKPVSGNGFLDMIDLTDEQDHPHEAFLRGTGDGLLVIPGSENNLMSVGSLGTLESDMDVQREGHPFACHVCSKGFKGKVALAKHMAVHSEDRPYKCGECGKSFKRTGEFRRHITVHSEERPFKCSVCGRGFKRKEVMILHKAMHSKRPYERNICRKRSMSLHVAVQNDILETENSTCMSKESENNFIKIETEHICGILDKDQQTLSSGEVSKTQHSARPHIAVRSKEKLYRCSICSKGFQTKRNQRRHMIVHSDDRPFECVICRQRFKGRYGLETHMHSHPQLNNRRDQGLDEFPAGVGQHMAVHKPYTCFECGKQFKFSHHMDVHMTLHTGETAYECKTCGKRFTAQQHLQNHMVVHSDDKPFECVICRKRCKTKNALASHIRSHTVKQPRRSNVSGDMLSV